MFILGAAIFSAYYFIFQGFPSDEYILYALGIHNIVQNGIVEIPKSFNGEMSFGYYVLLYGLMSLFKSNIELSRLMNSIGAVSSILMIYFIFRLFRSLLNDKNIALFICLNVMLAPSAWIFMHSGHPVIIAMTFYFGSLFYFDKLALNDFNFAKSKTDCISFIILSLLATMFRLDIFLAYGGYLGIMYFRGLVSIVNLRKIFSLFGISLIFLLLLRYVCLGYLINPTGGRLTYHIVQRLDSKYIFKDVLKNLALWVVGVNIFISFLAILGIIRFGTKSKLVVMLLLTTLPFCIFLPFTGMEISRLTLPTVPIIVAVAVFSIYTFITKRAVIALLLTIFIAQIVPIPMYYLIKSYYPLKVKIQDRYIAKVPIGFLFTDHYYRQKLIDTKTEIAKKVASEKEGDILIIDLVADGLYYIYYIIKLRHVLSSNFILEDASFDCKAYHNLSIGKFITDNNIFYILCVTNNWQHKAPISDTIQRFNICKDRIHLDNFMNEIQISKSKLYLNDHDLTNLLHSEKKIMETRRKLISK